MKTKVPQIYLEQLYLDELSSEKVEKITNKYPEKLLFQIEESNRKILDQYPPAYIKEKILRKLNTKNKNFQKKTNFRTHVLKFAPIAAALIFLTLNLGHLYQPEKNPKHGNIVRQKGLTPNLSVFKDNGIAPVELFNDDLVAESDIIQLTYNAAGKKFGVIFSIDGRGILTLHYPKNKYDTPAITPNGNHALPFSYELDDAPDFERFYFISSNKEFNISTVLKSAEITIKNGNVSTIKSLNLPSGFDQESILLRKDF